MKKLRNLDGLQVIPRAEFEERFGPLPKEFTGETVTVDNRVEFGDDVDDAWAAGPVATELPQPLNPPWRSRERREREEELLEIATGPVIVKVSSVRPGQSRAMVLLWSDPHHPGTLTFPAPPRPQKFSGRPPQAE